MAELRRLVEQRGSFGLILRAAAPGEAEHREREDRLAIAAVGGEREPGERLLLVLRNAVAVGVKLAEQRHGDRDRKSTRLNSSHANISYAVFCLKKKKQAPTVGSPEQPTGERRRVAVHR